MTQQERIAILDGIRTPMCKSGTTFRDVQADELGSWVVREIAQRSTLDRQLVDEIIIGNVAQPAHAANVARVIALKAGFDKKVPAMTVHRNCASGFEAVSASSNRLLLGQADLMIAGGVESMSNIPLLYNKEATRFFEEMMKSRTLGERLKTLATLRARFFFKPVIGLLSGLTDPICNQLMGMTAENLAREFGISREDQDKFALQSHQKALKAVQEGRFKDEIMSCPMRPDFQKICDTDNGPREGQSLDALGRLKPYFDRKNGTVTVGTSSQVTDGAAALLLCKESFAKARGIEPLGYIKGFAYAGCDPHRMGLGPAYSTAKLLKATGVSMKDIGLIELNEAFAAQVIANQKAFASREFAQAELGQDQAIGEFSDDILNVNGGAIALGHPLGMTGARLIITLLLEMKRRQLGLGLATCCIGGGQGASMLLETE